MMYVKQLYYDMAKAVKGICDKVYYQDRPSSTDERIDSYIVVCLPSGVYNNEIGQKGEYNDYETTAQFEIYVRDNTTSANPKAINVCVMSDKVASVLNLFPIKGMNVILTKPAITLQDSDGNGFHCTIIQCKLRTR